MVGTLQVLPLRLQFRALDAVWFPTGQPGNIIRGAFGTMLRRLVCVPECNGAKTCPIRDRCAYARIFEPRACGEGPSGLADRPRPFVFRAHHLDGRRVEPGEPFHFDLHLFALKEPWRPYFVETIAKLADAGLGPLRGRAELTGAEGRPLTLDLKPDPEPARRVRVRFLTPTELKSGSGLSEMPHFGILLARIRDRLSALSALYGEGPLEIDFKGMGERAALVKLARTSLHRVDAKRRSSKTGQVHPIGGFAGEAEYEGDLAEFLPYLRAAIWTGVGRQTVWGKGAIQVEPQRQP